jgi:hypothetical protein
VVELREAALGRAAIGYRATMLDHASAPNHLDPDE